jgi:hypothetical protein
MHPDYERLAHVLPGEADVILDEWYANAWKRESDVLEEVGAYDELASIIQANRGEVHANLLAGDLRMEERLLAAQPHGRIISIDINRVLLRQGFERLMSRGLQVRYADPSLATMPIPSGGEIVLVEADVEELYALNTHALKERVGHNVYDSASFTFTGGSPKWQWQRARRKPTDEDIESAKSQAGTAAMKFATMFTRPGGTLVNAERVTLEAWKMFPAMRVRLEAWWANRTLSSYWKASFPRYLEANVNTVRQKLQLLSSADLHLRGLYTKFTRTIRPFLAKSQARGGTA